MFPPVIANAGDIDCIAYYGITQGTSATTYSPLMAVSREHMALFLTRLAGLVGIPMVENPDDAGFTDIGDLSDKSQNAINQLAGLEIAKGTSDTTFSPGDSVRRDHMALFIARLMDQMTAVTDGEDDNGAEGSLPKDVEDGETPYSDLGSATKSAYDAITALYELGVASGISDTAYAPSALITRAAMAEFMAGVLDHSNTRPAGLSIQISESSGFGEASAVLMVSVRDDSFAPVEDQAVSIFELAADALNDDGTCPTPSVCQWSALDELTDENGNIIDNEAGADEDEMEQSTAVVFYAWIGDDDTTTFDADDDDVDYVSVEFTSYTEERAMSVDSDVAKNAQGRDTEAGPMVNLGETSSVTYTVQLRTADADAAHDVARAGASIRVQVSKGNPPTSVNTTTYETDEDGQVTFTVEGPEDDPDVDPDPDNSNASADDRTDTILITYVPGDPAAPIMGDDLTDTRMILWREAPSAVTTAVATAGSSYVIVEADGDARVSASVTYYDQYGDAHRQERGQTSQIDFTGNPPAADGDDPAGTNEGFGGVRSNGTAARDVTLTGQEAGMPIVLAFGDGNPTEAPDDIALPGYTATLAAGPIQVVTNADSRSTGERDVHTLYTDDNEFTTEEIADGDTDAHLLFSYDADDTFTDGDGLITMEEFEKLLVNDEDTGLSGATVDIVIYNPDGSSIFQVVPDDSQ